MNIFIYIGIIILVVFLYYINIAPKVIIKDECKYNRYGCCNDKLTTKLDQEGTNCRGF